MATIYSQAGADAKFAVEADLDAKVTELAEDPTSDLGVSLSSTYAPLAVEQVTLTAPLAYTLPEGRR